MTTNRPSFDRREFVRASAALAAATLAGGYIGRTAHAAGSDSIRVGVIGCGGRGTGAAMDALNASPNTSIVALADAFQDRINSCRAELTKPENEHKSRVTVTDEACHTGFDAYKQLLTADVDLVILATPPHFRPIHLAAAVAAGKHVFMEKPVAVDPAGIRSVLQSAQLAESKRLSIVAGTQRRHERSYLETFKRIQDGAIGPVRSGRVYWNQGGLWVVEPKAGWSEMEAQLRNWLYYTWLSGDHIVEQHVHNLDVANWVMGAHPVRCRGMGGRQVRTEPKYGHIFDHFAIDYEYPDGRSVMSMCRQIDGCASRVEETFHGASGDVVTSGGSGVITGKNEWRFSGDNPNPYVQEHIDLHTAIASGKPLNEARQVAESTLTAIMGRMSAYTGKEVTWEQALSSTLDLAPPSYAFGPAPHADVAVPGKTPLI